MFLTLTLDGKRNIDTAKKFQGNSCYRGIYNHGKRIAQMEIVIDYGEAGYCSISDKTGLIDISGVNLKDFDTVLNTLKRLGFSGDVGVFHDDAYMDYPWYDRDFCVFTKI